MNQQSERRRRIIITSGTSILRNLEKRGIDPSAKDVTAHLNKSWIEALEAPRGRPGHSATGEETGHVTGQARGPAPTLSLLNVVHPIGMV